MNTFTVLCFFIVSIACSSAQKETELNNNEPNVEASNGYPSVARSRVRASNTVEDDYHPMEPYAFGYNVKDDFGNNQYRKEEAGNDGVVKGSYGYTDAAGLYRVVEYIADRLGFRTKIRSNEPGLKSMSSSHVTLDAQNPPEAIAAAAAASSPKEVVAHPKLSLPSLPSPPSPIPSGLNPRFRYVASASELRPQPSENQRN
ncbi:cuticle protein 16.8-like [Tetranychus urticae]|uniref:Uncharacterized protein n=1 Tax=Tetranychus urticae TaxID=32264 RepID=T1L567_TETUR|nr:cuticle protein 16.8-like [Tetranychus urticae]